MCSIFTGIPARIGSDSLQRSRKEGGRIHTLELSRSPLTQYLLSASSHNPHPLSQHQHHHQSSIPVNSSTTDSKPLATPPALFSPFPSRISSLEIPLVSQPRHPPSLLCVVHDFSQSRLGYHTAFPILGNFRRLEGSFPDGLRPLLDPLRMAYPGLKFWHRLHRCPRGT